MNSYISIIIPTLNSEQTIGACLRSIIRQDYPSIEIIIIDGLSHDLTVNIIGKYAAINSNVKWISEKDMGVYDAMNKGISISKGDWIYFMGSDDTLINETIISEINSHILKNKTSKILYGNVKTSADYIQKYTNHTYRKLLSLNICHQAIFYHKSLFDNFKYDLRYPICADWDFNLKVFNSKNAPKYIDRVIANYNLNGLSGQWHSHEDYINNFSNKNTLILRYRSPLFLASTTLARGFIKIKDRGVKFYQWIFR